MQSAARKQADEFRRHRTIENRSRTDCALPARTASVADTIDPPPLARMGLEVDDTRGRLRLNNYC